MNRFKVIGNSKSFNALDGSVQDIIYTIAILEDSEVSISIEDIRCDFYSTFLDKYVRDSNNYGRISYDSFIMDKNITIKLFFEMLI